MNPLIGDFALLSYSVTVTQTYAQYPPGMRPGFPTPYVAQPAAVYPAAAGTFPVVVRPPGILSKEEFYKTKAEILEQKIKELVITVTTRLLQVLRLQTCQKLFFWNFWCCATI